MLQGGCLQCAGKLPTKSEVNRRQITLIYLQIMFAQVSGPRIGDKQELFWSPECLEKSWDIMGPSVGTSIPRVTG